MDSELQATNERRFAVGLVALFTAVLLVVPASVGRSQGAAAVQEPAVASCVVGHGYWKNHLIDWPAVSLELGGRSYAKQELLDLLKRPVRDDASVALAHQLIAAELNVLAGAELAPVAADFAEADELLAALGRLPAGVAPASETGQRMTSLAERLDAYNSARGDCAPFRIALALADARPAADAAVLGDLTPTIRLSGELPAGFRVIADRTDGRAGLNGRGKDLTALFRKVASGAWEATTPLLSGVTTIRITDAAGEPALSATLLAYSPALEDQNGNGVLDASEDVNGNGVLDPGEDRNGNGYLDPNEDFDGNGRLDTSEDADGDGFLDSNEDWNGNGRLDALASSVVPDTPDEVAYLPGTSQGYALGAIGLDFVDGAGDATASSYLRLRGLRPLGITVDNTIPARARFLTTAVPDGTESLALVKQMNGLPVDGMRFFPRALPVDPPLDAALPLLTTEAQSVAGERLPGRLVSGAPAPPSTGNAGERYNKNADAGFDDDGDGMDIILPKGPPPTGRLGLDELDIAGHHFAMDTFAAHRLVQKLTGAAAGAKRPVLAVVDSGLGDGFRDELDDLPRERIVRPTDCTIPFFCQVKKVEDIKDEKNHGTAVTVLAAGEGDLVLGTGRDVDVRPVKRITNDLDQSMFAVAKMAEVDDVRVVNVSWGVSKLDVNGDHVIQNFTENGNPVDEADQAISVYEAQLNRLQPTLRALANAPTPKIVVAGAGNNFFEPTALAAVGAPASAQFFNAPERGQRKAGADNALVLAVGATWLQDDSGAEARVKNSNAGAQISVVAPGGAGFVEPPQGPVAAVLPDGATYQSFGGTSAAAPRVAGLVAELLWLDEGSDAVALKPLQVVELVEATADDLGTTGGPEFVNDAPGTPGDDYFGHGRINAWKATLAAVNGGVPEESHVPGSFTSLTGVGEAATKWYGFKILTRVKGATVWLDGVRLDESSPSVPDPMGAAGARTNAINAYAGIRSTAVPRPMLPGSTSADPTSGVVPFGNAGGEHVITFSIERTCTQAGDKLCLLRPDGTPRTLSLRQRGDDAKDAPFLNLELDLAKMRAGKVPGVVFDDFVFEITPPDFHDGPGAPAWHVNSNLEWLGEQVSPEFGADDAYDADGVPNTGDVDRFDDGVVLAPLGYKPGTQGTLEFTPCVADRTSNRYSAAPGTSVYVNGWIDWDADRIFEDDEHVVPGVQLNPKTWTEVVKPGEKAKVKPKPVGAPGQQCATFEASFTVPATIGKGDLWARFRLDFGENAGANKDLVFTALGQAGASGAARYGEVEDHVIRPDFGDADDRYPTRKEKQGARHLDGSREWLGRAVTREPDACLPSAEVSADEDGVANIGTEEEECKKRDQDVADEAVIGVGEGGAVEVEFTAHSSISQRGYDLRGAGPTVDVKSLGETCAEKTFPGLPTTPPWSAGKGRYAALPVQDASVPGSRPLVANIWIDWANNGSWAEPGDHVLQDALIAPETFGPDETYTLGEPFVDANHDGVFQAFEDFTDVAGIDEKTFKCSFNPPGPRDNDAVLPSVRIRLAYAELSNETVPGSGVPSESLVEAGLASATEEERELRGELGGALFGEVEDYPLPPPDDSGTPPPPPPGECPQPDPGPGCPLPVPEKRSVTVLKLDDQTSKPLPGWSFSLHRSADCSGAPIDSKTTDAKGLLDFTELDPDVYSVKESLQPGYTNVTPLCQSADLTKGVPETTVPWPEGSFPPAGVESFASGMQLQLTLNGQTFTVNLNGQSTVTRSEPGDADGDGLRDQETELSFELRGDSPLGPIVVRTDPTRPSLGQIEANAPGNDFPATSYHDVFLEIETPLGVVRVANSLRVQATITGQPATMTVFTDPTPPAPISLVTPGGQEVGAVTGIVYVPLLPGEKLLTFRNRPVVTIPPPAKRSVRVIKLDHRTLQPLPGGSFALFAGPTCSSTPIGSGTTGEDGLLDFTELDPGVYSVRQFPQSDLFPVTPTCQKVDLASGFGGTTAPPLPGSFPPAGEDRFDSGAVLVAKIAFKEHVLTVNGATTQGRGDAGDFDGDGLRDVATEITSAELTGDGSLGPVVVRERPDEVSSGEIEALLPGTDFPAEAFTTLSLEIQTQTLGILRTISPLELTAKIHALPPGPAVYSQPFPTTVPLVGPTGGIGAIFGAVHVPLPPGEKLVAFTNLRS